MSLVSTLRAIFGYSPDRGTRENHANAFADAATRVGEASDRVTAKLSKETEPLAALAEELRGRPPRRKKQGPKKDNGAG